MRKSDKGIVYLCVQAKGRVEAKGRVMAKVDEGRGKVDERAALGCDLTIAR